MNTFCGQSSIDVDLDRIIFLEIKNWRIYFRCNNKSFIQINFWYSSLKKKKILHEIYSILEEFSQLIFRFFFLSTESSWTLTPSLESNNMMLEEYLSRLIFHRCQDTGIFPTRVTVLIHFSFLTLQTLKRKHRYIFIFEGWNNATCV